MKRSREDENEGREEDLLQTLLTTIVNLGDPHAKVTFEEELHMVSTDMIRQWPSSAHSISSSLCQSLLSLPHKTEKYALLIGLLAEKNREMAVSILDRLTEGFVEEDKKWWSMAQLLRVFGDLATLHVIPVESLIQIIDLYKQRSDGAMHSMAYSLPFFSKILSASHSEYLQQLLVDFNSSQMKKTALVLARESPLCRLSPIDGSEPFYSVRLPDHLTFPQMPTLIPIRCIPTDGDPMYVDSWEEWVTYTWLFILVDSIGYNPNKCCEVLLNAVNEDVGASEKVVVQALFGGLFSGLHVPSEFLLIICCRLSRSFPSALCRTVMKLVESPLDHVAMCRLSSWFALHLSTFDFKWPWSEWLAADMFLQYSFEQLSRLSYHEKLVGSIPSQMHHLLPPNPTPIFRFHEDAGEILAGIRSKMPSSELSALGSNERIVESILFVGSKSFSHVLVLIERYLDIFKSVDSQESLLDLISNFWRNHQQNFETIAVKLIEYNVLDSVKVCKWMIESFENAVNDGQLSVFACSKRYLPIYIIDICCESNCDEFKSLLLSVKDRLIVDKDVQEECLLICSSFAKYISEELI